MRLVHLLLLGLGITMIAWGTSGCATARPDAGQLVRGAVDVLDVLCSTREALTAAKEHLDRGDVGGAIDLLKAYLVEHGPDPEVAAVLQLLEAQVNKLAFREPPTDWGF
jgi:hypothetical protein